MTAKKKQTQLSQGTSEEHKENPKSLEDIIDQGQDSIRIKLAIS